MNAATAHTARARRRGRLLGCVLGSLVLGSVTNAASRAPLPTDFSGTYLLVQQTVTVTELPVVADVETTTRAVSIQRLEQRGDSLRGHGPLCSLALESSSSLVETTLPDAFRRALPEVVTEARLVHDGETVRFLQAPQVSVIGARLRRLASDPLPTSPTDPRVFDQDRDGKPGMTVRVSGLVSGEVYVTQRGTSSLRGTLLSNRVFTGSIVFRNEQRILGATSRYLESAPEGKPDLAKSKFWLVPVLRDITCRDAIAAANRWR